MTTRPVFTKEEIQELSLGQLSEHELDEANTAFNGFARLFGRKWVTDYFRGQSAVFSRALIRYWRDWATVGTFPNAEQLIGRWRAGVDEMGVATEILVLASLARRGGQPELFVEIDGRVPDCRIREDAQADWVYVEMSARGLSEIRRRGQDILWRVSHAAADAVPGMHGKVALLRPPSAEELEEVVRWLAQRPNSGDALTDIAEFYTDTIESGIGGNDVLEQRVPRPRMFSTRVVTGERLAKGSASLRISDEAADRALQGEAEQLPREQAGVVVLDVSGVIDGIDAWTPLIGRRFQPGINRRIGGVILMARNLSVAGLKMRSELLVNPHAAKPLTDRMRAILGALGDMEV